ncbi:uncharacterized protein LOC124185364 isoform X1 [Neodiprion fabricii]|uniref:uncharacterized protein LOC124185364 isoform X1 n=1 Tax=Neodiprion fabricii TaxID=2872261 RepID=UPI001ED958B2|nr:uncharacterized protein LOC124185364 isoform X1 [Neodiprion fabricii]XP_046432007.1 uncharacterized protein LOC124185364 isoform X1 [Neodiprion fabricii]
MARANNLDNWDPMAAHYRDANVNSYEHGPGMNLTPYARGGPETEFKLYVSNIPAELDQDGVSHLFANYGTPSSVISPPNAGWAFVSYTSFREAEKAIREVHGVKPLELRVTFAKKREERLDRNMGPRRTIESKPVPFTCNPENQPREYISPEQIPRHAAPPTCNMGRGKNLAALVHRAVSDPVSDPVYYEEDDCLYPVPNDPAYYNPYENAEPFLYTNNLWTRDRLKVSTDGTRYVTMGRGYTRYELPPRYPNVHQHIRAVYEKREAGLYQYGENRIAEQIGKCQYCTKPASGRCQRCQEFYCNRACQVADWPRHKVDCQEIPGLDPGIDLASLSISSGDEQPVQSMNKRSILKLRRPVKRAEFPNAPNSTSTPILDTSLTFGKENIPIFSQNQHKRDHFGDQKRVFDKSISHNSGGWKPVNNGDSQILRTANAQGRESNTNHKINLVNEMPKAEIQTQQVPKDASRPESSKSSSHGSYRVKDAKEQNMHQLKTQVQVQHSNKLTKTSDRGEPRNQEQEIYQQTTHQNKSMQINNAEIAKPKFKLDLGDPDISFRRVTNAPGHADIRPVSKGALHQNNDAVAGQSRSQPTTKPVENDVNAKKIAQSCSKGEAAQPYSLSNSPTKTTGMSQNAQAPPLSPAKGPKNIVELLDEKEEGCFEAHVLLGGNKAAVTVCVEKFRQECEDIFSVLPKECDKISVDPNFKPKVGDLICGKRQDDWIRGTVQSLVPSLRLFAVDEGRVESVSAVKPLPQGFRILPTLGAICEVSDAEFKLEPMSQYVFAVVNNKYQDVSKDGIEIIVYNSEQKSGKAILKPWAPTSEQKGVPYASLTSGTEICIASFRNHNMIFVRSLVPSEMETFNRLTQEVAKWSTKVQKLTELPVVGEMVLAKYIEDGNFYRAIVRQIKEQKIIVSYVDFGNSETTSLENLRPISNSLKEYKSCVARIVLKNVPKDVPMTKELSEYLGMLAGMEKPLMCTFEGSPFTDGVILKASDGTCINEKVLKLLTPSWKTEEDEKTVFLLSDLEVAELGESGQTLNVLSLFSYGPLLHILAPYDVELINHINDVMATQIKDYCDQQKDHYIPRPDELCIAPYEGIWYRAVCLETNTTPTESTVNFIDFGNVETVSHKNIKVMNKDFMSTKTLANVCQVVNLGPLDEAGDLQPKIAKRVEELVPNNSAVMVKIVERSKPGEYIVEFPEIRDILVKEGLIEV